MIAYRKATYSVSESLVEGVIRKYDTSCSDIMNCHQSGNPAAEVRQPDPIESSDNCSIEILTVQKPK